MILTCYTAVKGLGADSSDSGQRPVQLVSGITATFDLPTLRPPSLDLRCVVGIFGISVDKDSLFTFEYFVFCSPSLLIAGSVS